MKTDDGSEPKGMISRAVMDSIKIIDSIAGLDNVHAPETGRIVMRCVELSSEGYPLGQHMQLAERHEQMSCFGVAAFPADLMKRSVKATHDALGNALEEPLTITFEDLDDRLPEPQWFQTPEIEDTMVDHMQARESLTDMARRIMGPGGMKVPEMPPERSRTVAQFMPDET